jgi:putative spermidine/putrescine transport system permease protein
VAEALRETPVRPAFSRSASAFLDRHRWLRLSVLLAAPMFWLVVVYLASLGALFVTAFWSTDSFTSEIVRDWNLDNYRLLYQSSVYRTIILRTLAVASGVTVLCAAVAIPFAYYMAKVAGPRARKVLVVAALMPLWVSYLIKGFSWRILIGENGPLDNTIGTTPGFGLVAVVLTLSYLWLPYMVLPVYAGFERLPDSLLDASGDLGARPGRTFLSVVVPAILPSVVAGSIFTFSLSMGDYIAVDIVGGRTQMLGTVVNDNYTLDLPFAAAMASLTVVIMVIYLRLVRRTGALENI